LEVLIGVLKFENHNAIIYFVQARDLPKIIVAAYHLIPHFIFSPQEGLSLSSFFKKKNLCRGCKVMGGYQTLDFCVGEQL
jgi:hypothetical protein